MTSVDPHAYQPVDARLNGCIVCGLSQRMCELTYRPMPPADPVDILRQRMRDTGNRFAANRADRVQLAEALAVLAREATEAGISERDIAAVMGVDRMTVRRWLGK